MRIYIRPIAFRNIHDLPKSSKKFNFINFADGITLSVNLNDFSSNFKNIDIGAEINKEIFKIALWLKRNFLVVNTEKTKIIIHHN